MKFKYKDRVKITDGFYGERVGDVVDYSESFKSFFSFKLRFRYLVEMDCPNKFEWFWESQLERIEEE